MHEEDVIFSLDIIFGRKRLKHRFASGRRRIVKDKNTLTKQSEYQILILKNWSFLRKR